MADAAPILNQISGALDGLGAQIQNTYNEPPVMNTQWGWNMPAMTVPELGEYARLPMQLIRRVDATAISEADIAKLNEVPDRISYIANNAVQHTPSGNAVNVYSVINSLVDHLTVILGKYDTRNDRQPFDLEKLEADDKLPAAQLKQLRTIARGIQKLSSDSADLQQKIAEINDAHGAAQSFPADVHMLEETRAEFETAKEALRKTLTEVSEDAGITLGQAGDSAAKIADLERRLAQSEIEAKNILSRLGAAYSAATTVGLGKAFSERASALNISTYILGAVLVTVLAIGGLITYLRVEFVHQLMLKPNPSYGLLWINVTFTALSVSAPVWLAWFLTRQIGQRFRLAEDYGYKASIAKAYEGYRREAASIDPELSKVLFATALEKLGEAPLRLVEKESPGSPAHDVQGKIVERFKRKSPEASKEPTPPPPPADPEDDSE